MCLGAAPVCAEAFLFARRGLGLRVPLAEPAHRDLHKQIAQRRQPRIECHSGTETTPAPSHPLGVDLAHALFLPRRKEPVAVRVPGAFEQARARIASKRAYRDVGLAG
jgi:hypothetical protein